MKRRAYLRLIFIAIAGALLLSVSSLLCLIKYSDLAFRDHRQNLLLFVARSIESNPQGLKLPPFPPFGPPRGPPPGFDPKNFRGPPPPPPPPPDFDPQKFAGHRPPPPMGFPPPPPPGGGEFPEFWIVSANNEIISDNKEQELPKDFFGLKKPEAIHGTRTTDSLWNFFDRVTIMRLEHDPAAYLVISEKRNPFRGPLFATQGIFTFGTVIVALFFSLTFTFYYLRKKSEEASSVLLRMERGDLHARFEIKAFDQFGGLMLDFNRMAQEIERLVTRVRETENARRNLLSELGHDLRTPLTSLMTSFETLKVHFNKMTPSDRNETFTMITAEVEYFKELLEKLMTIAELDEPHYKKSLDNVDLVALIQQELRFRQNSSNSLQWNLSTENLKSPSTAVVRGDSYLLMRLLKNALDNASRFAKTKVNIEL
ncbi:MAG TPA: histidine kinase dimerization/phospho-acceptor domain-containing protein, partial [Bdellovibrio sp.]|nr:histidine kinase dimerization/phospho-acceptor domain-containing protein [Bdellovibrio sp.]